jgi:hypothetical protein
MSGYAACAPGGMRSVELVEASLGAVDGGHLNERGQPFNAQSVRAMIEGPQSRLPRAKG